MKKKVRTRILGWFLAAIILPGVVPTTVQADTDVYTGHDITVNSTVVGFAGQQWWVIGKEGSIINAPENSVVLLLKSNGNPYGDTNFRTSSLSNPGSWKKYGSLYYEGSFTKPNDYSDSTLQRAMRTIALGFSAEEAALIKSRNLAASDDMTGIGENQELWPLSRLEWQVIGNDTVRSYGNEWWLRTPLDGDDTHAFFSRGTGNMIPWASVSTGASGVAVRPAFYLDLSKVLFTSSISGPGKKLDTISPLSNRITDMSVQNSPIKFTMVDETQTLTVKATTAQSTQTGSSLAFSYEDAAVGSDRYISCVLTDLAGKVKYYIKLNQTMASGGALGIPLSQTILGSGSELPTIFYVSPGAYKLKIFSEKIGGDYETDFASAPVTMDLSVGVNGVGTVSNFGGIIDDSDPPVSPIRVLPTAAVVQKGKSQQFTGRMAIYDTDLPGSFFNWSVEGGAAGTSINSGLLSIAAGETAKTLTVKAASKANSSVFGTASVTVISVPAAIASDQLNLDLNGVKSMTIPVTLGESGGLNVCAEKATIAISGDAVDVTPEGITADGNIAVIGQKAGNATISICFSGGDVTDTTYDRTITVNVADSTPHLFAVDMGGSVSGTANGSYKSGTPVSVQATAKSGYRFMGWDAKGVILADPNTVTAVFNMPGNAVALTARFGLEDDEPESDKYPLTVNAGAGSSFVSVAEAGMPIRITAAANKGYRFTGWAAEGVVLTAPDAITAVFEMPGNAVVLTACYIPQSSGVGSSSSSSGERMGSTTPATAPEQKLDEPVATGQKTPFTDVGNHWARASIDYVVGSGLFFGSSNTTFAPDAPMTRGMLVAVLGRLAGMETKAYTASGFVDVREDSAFGPYIQWAYEQGIVQGIGNSRFAPDRAITREELAAILANYTKFFGDELPVTGDTRTFADDSNIGAPYRDAVKMMQEAGVMTGDRESKFNPTANATRGEVASMLHRYKETITRSR